MIRAKIISPCAKKRELLEYYQPGDVVELTESEYKRLFNAMCCVPYSEPTKQQAPERAIRRPVGRRKKT